MAIPSLFQETPAAVRVPSFEIGFGDAELWSKSLVSLRLDLGLGSGIDTAELILGKEAAAPSGGLLAAAAASVFGGDDGGSGKPAVGDSGEIALGYEDEGTETVFTGTVEQVTETLSGTTRYLCANGGAALARLRVNQSYEQQTAGDLVKELTGMAGVETGTIEDGVELAFIVLDDRTNAYRHIADLALRSGFPVFFNPDGSLEFAPPSGGSAVQTFTYGLDILSLNVKESTPGLSGATFYGEGAAGSEGKDAWSWLVKDPAPVTGEIDGDPARSWSDDALRSGDAAGTAAAGRLTIAGLANVTGTLWAPGAPKIVPGVTIDIAEAPESIQNGSFLVRHVRHSYSKRSGFTSLISLSKAGEGGFGLDLGSLGGLL